MNEKFLYEYDQEAVRIKTENSIRHESYEKGKEAGIEQGTKQEKIEIAKNLLNLKMNPRDISKATGLSLEEIKKIEE